MKTTKTSKKLNKLVTKHIIIVTDGDLTAAKTVRKAAEALNADFIENSAGNPTPDSPEKIVECIERSTAHTVLVLADDGGGVGKGRGSILIETLISQSLVSEAIIVASNQRKARGSRVLCSVSAKGTIVKNKGVTKRGELTKGNLVKGDTVDVLRMAKIPKVGIGDIGKAPRGDRSIEILKMAILTALGLSRVSYAKP